MLNVFLLNLYILLSVLNNKKTITVNLLRVEIKGEKNNTYLWSCFFFFPPRNDI